MKKREGRSMVELRAAVKKGISILDARIPQWRRIFKTTPDFDFENPCRCVIGFVGSCQPDDPEQLWADEWHKGKKALGIEHSIDLTMGFDWEHRSEIPLLTNLWKTEFKRAVVR